jgi:predicted RNA-binding protein with PUA-like domain
MKTEPSTFGIDTLWALPNRSDYWDGVRNYQARNFMRDQMKKGDLAFFYHSNCPIPGVVGIMEIIETQTPDPSALNPESQYYDPKSTAANNRWVRVKVKGKQKFKRIISLAEIKSHPNIKEVALVRAGNRLSVMPISAKEWNVILQLSQSSGNST